MTANNALQRTSEHRGRTVRACMCARAGAEWVRAWPLNSVVRPTARAVRGEA